MEKFPKLLENHKSFSSYNVIRKGERECKKKRRFGNQQPSRIHVLYGFGRLRDYNGNLLLLIKRRGMG